MTSFLTEDLSDMYPYFCFPELTYLTLATSGTSKDLSSGKLIDGG